MKRGVCVSMEMGDSRYSHLKSVRVASCSAFREQETKVAAKLINVVKEAKNRITQSNKQGIILANIVICSYICLSLKLSL